MAGSLNKVTIIGNLGRDPEIRSTGDGKKLASFSLATTDSWKDRNGERKEKTEWHRVVIYNEALVGVVENYVKKGSKLYIEGSLQTRKWVDQTGVEKYTTEIVLQSFGSQLILLDNKNSGSFSEKEPSFENPGKSHKTEKFDESYSDLDDEIPF